MYLLPLHIHVGLIKISVKAMDKKSEGFAYWRQIFSKISAAKTKEVIFFGSQITQILEDQDFSTKLNSTEIRAWKAYANVCRNFVSNEHAKNCTEIVQELISPYTALDCSVASKLHFLHSRLEFFSWKHGSCLRWAWRKVLSGYFRIWKNVQWNMESKYVGWLLLESYKVDTNGENKRQKKTKWGFNGFFSS